MAAAVAATLALELPGPGRHPTVAPPAPSASPPQSPPPSTGSVRWFAPTSFWNAPLAANAPLVASSASDVAKLTHQVFYSKVSSPVQGYFSAGRGVAVNPLHNAPPVWTVPAGQPTVTVQLVDKAGRPRPTGWAQGLQGELNAVPVPSGVNVAPDGSDAMAVVWQPSTDTMWEFWKLTDASGHWTARYGGRLQHVSQANGIYPNHWGARATSLALAGGLLTMADYARGAADHVLVMNVPVVTGGFVAPATRADGPYANDKSRDGRDALPEGARFRLPAGFDCASLPNHTKLAAMICAAVRDYGIVIVGGSQAVNVWAENPMTVGTPYADSPTNPWASIRSSDMAGPTSVLQTFPWDKLQEVAPCVTAGCQPDPSPWPVTTPAERKAARLAARHAANHAHRLAAQHAARVTARQVRAS